MWYRRSRNDRGCVRKVHNLKLPSRKINCRNYKNYEPKQLNGHLRTQDWDRVYNSEDVNSAWMQK